MNTINLHQKQNYRSITDQTHQSVIVNSLKNNSIERKNTTITNRYYLLPYTPIVYRNRAIKAIYMGYMELQCTIGNCKTKELNNNNIAITDQKEEGRNKAQACKADPKKQHPGDAFLTFLRTLQLMKLRLKGIDEGKAVHVDQKQIETRYFTYPEYDRKAELQKLIDDGKLEITEKISPTSKRPMKLYRCLVPGEVDLSLIPNREPLPPLEAAMMANLLRVSLKDGAPSTDYFNTFLRYRGNFLRLFFTVDKFAGRVHTPITNFHRTHRPNLLIDGSPTVSFDVATMQPLLLGKILQDNVGDNNFSTWIRQGHDVYVMLQKTAKLETRDQGKKRFFELIFAPASSELATMFGDDNKNWIDWINNYKLKPEPRNPHTGSKRYSNLAWLLQTTEADTMRKVWELLIEVGIPFLSVHDEIICRELDRQPAASLFAEILDQTFKYYKLNVDKGIQAPDTESPANRTKLSYGSILGEVQYMKTHSTPEDDFITRDGEILPFHHWLERTRKAYESGDESAEKDICDMRASMPQQKTTD